MVFCSMFGSFSLSGFVTMTSAGTALWCSLTTDFTTLATNSITVGNGGEWKQCERFAPSEEIHSRERVIF